MIEPQLDANLTVKKEGSSIISVWRGLLKFKMFEQ